MSPTFPAPAHLALHPLIARMPSVLHTPSRKRCVTGIGPICQPILPPPALPPLPHRREGLVAEVSRIVHHHALLHHGCHVGAHAHDVRNEILEHLRGVDVALSQSTKGVKVQVGGPFACGGGKWRRLQANHCPPSNIGGDCEPQCLPPDHQSTSTKHGLIEGQQLPHSHPP